MIQRSPAGAGGGDGGGGSDNRPGPQGRGRWPTDPFAVGELAAQAMWGGGWIVVVALMVLAGLLARGLRPGADLIVYAAQDQVYAEPILRDFEAQTGLRVRAVYDSEAVKTVGLANRLIAERAHPRCDVVWGNEELRTRQLAALGIFRETNGWAAFGHRSRRLAVRSESGTGMEAGGRPSSVRDLTNAAWAGKVALAYPLFGSTSTHLLALRQHWGESNWLGWCRALMANRPVLADGNSGAVRVLQRGDVQVAWTDSDDVIAARRESASVASASGGGAGGHGSGGMEMLPMGPETLLLPNTVAVVRGAPHPAAAQRLFEYLQTADVVGRLVAAGALEGAAAPADLPGTLRPDWDELVRDLDRGTAQLQEVFRR